MTKKHYEAIADILKSNAEKLEIDNSTYAELYHKAICNQLADYFATDNKNFKRDMFLTACGIESDARKCHLCDALEVDKYCTNTSCYEYTRYEKS